MRSIVFSLLLIGTLTLSGCALDKMIKMSEQQELTVTPSPLEVHGDSVTFEMSAVLPLKMLKKGKIYTIYPFYTYNGQEVALEGIEFKADDFINSPDQPRLTQSFTFAYDPAMKQGTLEVSGEAKDPRNGKTKATEGRAPIAEGMITTSMLVQDPFYTSLADHGYNNQEELIPTEVSFFFQQGRSNLRRSEIRSERGNFFDAFIAEKNVTRTVTITGTHSPEGAERINSRLAEERAMAIEKYYRQQMEKYDYQDMAEDVEFILKPVVEDWSTLKAGLESYEGISDEQKQQVLNIINGSGDFEEKEDELHKLSFYNKMFRELYPELRRAKTNILTVKPKKTDAEISILAKQIYMNEVSADTLSIEELLYAATLTPSLDEKIKIYTAAVAKSDSWVSHNNLGAVLLQKAKMNDNDAAMVEKAITQLELAMNQNANSATGANLTTAYFLQGNMMKAWETAGKVAGMANAAGEDVRGANGIKGAIEITLAKYNDAVNTFGNVEGNAVNLFNKALALTLKKDYRNAMTAANDSNEEQEMAITYYLMAVISARQNQASGVESNLTKAIDADPELKEMATIDLEFQNFGDAVTAAQN